MHRRTLLSLIVACGLAVSLSGCGGGGPTAKVTGKVTYQDQPVPKGTVIVEGADGVLARGNLQDDGSFTIPNAPLGQIKVAIQIPETLLNSAPGAAGSGDREDSAPPGYTPPVDIPAKYKKLESTDLTYEITSDSSSWNLDIALE